MTLHSGPAGLPLRRPYGKESVAVLTGLEARELDRLAIDDLGIPSPVLIEAAGRAAAGVAQYLRPKGPVAVLAGKGNNGADAVVVARTLASWGREVVLVPVSETLDRDLLHGWAVPVVDMADAGPHVSGAALVVDGILGTGLRGRPRGPEAAGIAMANEGTGLRVALDLPSGVHADTGAVEGAAIMAQATVGFGSAKLGAVLDPGRKHVGRHIVVDIGFPPTPVLATRLITPSWSSARLPERSPDAHKNSVGAVAVVAGHQGMAGAAILAARAALRVGAGYVRVITDGANREIIQGSIPEAVFVDRADDDAVGEAVAASRSILIGPALGVDGAGYSLIDHVMHHASDYAPVVLDADALTLLSDATASGGLDALRGRSVLLTPHLGEMSRLTGTSTTELKSDLLGAAGQLAERWGVDVLLKGSPTLVAQPSGAAWLATSQTSDLAVAGMGDTLAGTIVGLAAQGLVLTDAAAVALDVTSRAAQLAGGGRGLIPSDVVEHLGAAAMEVGSGDTDLPFSYVLFDQDAPR